MEGEIRGFLFMTIRLNIVIFYKCLMFNLRNPELKGILSLMSYVYHLENISTDFLDIYSLKLSCNNLVYENKAFFLPCEGSL